MGERAARARAARGYAGLSQKQLAQALGISIETLSRLENGHREVSIEEGRRISEICHVPLIFMEAGFDAIPRDDQAVQQSVLARRLERVEEALEALLVSGAPPRRAPVSGGGLPEIPGELGRRLRAARQALEGHAPPQTAGVQGQTAAADE